MIQRQRNRQTVDEVKGMSEAKQTWRQRLGARIAGQPKQERGVIHGVAANTIALWMEQSDIDCAGYTRLSDNPEIQTACLKIAELIGSMTIRLMGNTDDGDVRIQNELSRMIDITPCDNMTRMKWMTAVVMTMLLPGNGNSVVVPHTRDGLLTALEPISAHRVSFQPVTNSYRDYRILIDGKAYNPADVMHFTYNPDETYLWKGKGITVSLQDVANNLKQAAKTKSAFMKSEWKPSIIVKVDGLSDEFSSPEGRERLLESYVKPAHPGDPWMIPSEAFDVKEVRPLTLGDLAINDSVTLDKKTIASVIGVPAFLLGVGEFKRDEWNNFIQTKLRDIALGIQQEMTRALIINPKWYLEMNFWSLMDYDLKSMSDILLNGADRGYVNGDEWRNRMHMAPAGLKEFKILENYIPADMSGAQKKLVQSE